MAPESDGQPIMSGLEASSIQAPVRAGLGFKWEHTHDVLGPWPDVGFFEVHAENYLVDGGPLPRTLQRLRERYPLSTHGVGLSIGGEEPLDRRHLDAVATLVRRFEPAHFSEHLAWSSHGGQFLNDLLPLPYDQPTLQRVCAHVQQVQDALRRPMLLENPSTYLAIAGSTWSEGDFLHEIVRRTGCALLLDINNVYVSAINHGLDPLGCLHALPWQAARQMHMAGFAEDRDGAGDRLLIDHHGAAVDEAVWALFDSALALTGPLPTLLERDNDLPAFSVLQTEAGRIERHLRRAGAAGQARAGLEATT